MPQDVLMDMARLERELKRSLSSPAEAIEAIAISVCDRRGAALGHDPKKARALANRIRALREKHPEWATKVWKGEENRHSKSRNRFMWDHWELEMGLPHVHHSPGSLWGEVFFPLWRGRQKQVYEPRGQSTPEFSDQPDANIRKLIIQGDLDRMSEEGLTESMFPEGVNRRLLRLFDDEDSD